jgi:hypothetical protein
MGSFHSPNHEIRLAADPSPQGYVMRRRRGRARHAPRRAVRPDTHHDDAGGCLLRVYASSGHRHADLSTATCCFTAVVQRRSARHPRGPRVRPLLRVRYRRGRSLPYFIPLWLPWVVPMPGTLGAVIRIGSRSRRSASSSISESRSDRGFSSSSGARDRDEPIDGRHAGTFVGGSSASRSSFDWSRGSFTARSPTASH